MKCLKYKMKHLCQSDPICSRAKYRRSMHGNIIHTPPSLYFMCSIQEATLTLQPVREILQKEKGGKNAPLFSFLIIIMTSNFRGTVKSTRYVVVRCYLVQTYKQIRQMTSQVFGRTVTLTNLLRDNDLQSLWHSRVLFSFGFKWDKIEMAYCIYSASSMERKMPFKFSINQTCLHIFKVNDLGSFYKDICLVPFQKTYTVSSGFFRRLQLFQISHVTFC